MKKVILILIVAVKMQAQSPVKFESSESFIINVNSEMTISAGVGANINSKTQLPLISSTKNKSAVYERMLDRFFNNGKKETQTFLCKGKDSVIINVDVDGNKQTIDRSFFCELNNTVKLEKSETLVIINEKF
jgi:hypothetical protein